MPKRTDISSILIIGADPIIIGQACEFDRMGTQAVRRPRGLSASPRSSRNHRHSGLPAMRLWQKPEQQVECQSPVAFSLSLRASLRHGHSNRRPCYRNSMSDYSSGTAFRPTTPRETGALVKRQAIRFHTESLQLPASIGQGLHHWLPAKPTRRDRRVVWPIRSKHWYLQESKPGRLQIGVQLARNIEADPIRQTPEFSQSIFGGHKTDFFIFAGVQKIIASPIGKFQQFLHDVFLILFSFKCLTGFFDMSYSGSRLTKISLNNHLPQMFFHRAAMRCRDLSKTAFGIFGQVADGQAGHHGLHQSSM
jgi:hypothetical protein